MSDGGDRFDGLYLLTWVWFGPSIPLAFRRPRIPAGRAVYAARQRSFSAPKWAILNLTAGSRWSARWCSLKSLGLYSYSDKRLQVPPPQLQLQALPARERPLAPVALHASDVPWALTWFRPSHPAFPARFRLMARRCRLVSVSRPPHPVYRTLIRSLPIQSLRFRAIMAAGVGGVVLSSGGLPRSR